MSVFICQRQWLLFHPTLMLLLSLFQSTKLLFPSFFERTGDQTVLWFNGILLPPGSFRLILETFQMQFVLPLERGVFLL